MLNNNKPIISIYGDQYLKKLFKTYFQESNNEKYKLLEISNFYDLENIGRLVSDYILVFININESKQYNYIEELNSIYVDNKQKVKFIIYNKITDEEITEKQMEIINKCECDYTLEFYSEKELTTFNSFIDIENDTYFKNLTKSFKDNIIINIYSEEIEILNYNFIQLMKENLLPFSIKEPLESLNENSLILKFTPINIKLSCFRLFEIVNENINITDDCCNNEIIETFVQEDNDNGIFVSCNSLKDLIKISLELQKHDIAINYFSLAPISLKSNFNDIISEMNYRFKNKEIINKEKNIIFAFYKTILIFGEQINSSMKKKLIEENINLLDYPNFSFLYNTLENDLIKLKNNFIKKTNKFIDKIDSTFQLNLIKDPIIKNKKGINNYLKANVICKEGMIKLNQESNIGKIIKIKLNNKYTKTASENDYFVIGILLNAQGKLTDLYKDSLIVNKTNHPYQELKTQFIKESNITLFKEKSKKNKFNIFFWWK